MMRFNCVCHCDHDDCSRFHNPPRPPCNCIRQISKSTKFIERVIDCAETISRVLTICGIHECKSKAAVDVIVFGFLHFDIVPDQVSDVLRKKLRKEDIFYDLGRKCLMNRIEAHLAYLIIKRAFKAFYFKKCADRYNLDYIEETQWVCAAQKTAETYAASENMTVREKTKLENRIKVAYCSFIQRVEAASKKEAEYICCCSFCNKDDKGLKFYTNLKPREDEDALKFKQRLIEEGKKAANCPPDPCGYKILEWLTQVKTATNTSQNKLSCTCGEETKCFLHPKCGCGQIPCICKSGEENNLIVQSIVHDVVTALVDSIQN